MAEEKKKKLPYRLWVIYGNEEAVLGLVLARTQGGALRRFSEETYKSRDTIYAEQADISTDNKVLRFPYRH